MAPKAKRGRKADKEEKANKKAESNKKAKVKDKTPKNLEDDFLKFIGAEKDRLMKEFEEEKERIVSVTEDYNQMIREVMWVSIFPTGSYPDFNFTV